MQDSRNARTRVFPMMAASMRARRWPPARLYTLAALFPWALARAEQRCCAELPPIETITTVKHTSPFGRAVYASRRIAPGSLLGIYPGRKLAMRDFLEKERDCFSGLRYAYYLSAQEVIDPTDIFGRVGDSPQLRLALINEPPPDEWINVASISSSRYVWYATVRSIEAGEQLFTTYGPNYARDYPTAPLGSGGVVGWSQDEAAELCSLGARYPWLRQGVRDLLSAGIAQNATAKRRRRRA